VTTHGFGNAFAIFTILDTLAGHVLDLGTSNNVSKFFDQNAIPSSPVLEPNLNRSLRHVNVIGNTFSDEGSRSWVLVELDLKCKELILCGSLSLLVLLLLSQGALPWWASCAVVQA